MNLPGKLFAPGESASPDDRRQQIQENANLLWASLEQTISFWLTIACPCAFPRFRQYAAIDCTDYGASFYMSETEGLIFHAKNHYDISDQSGSEANNATWTCKKCRSTFDYGWSDFSIHVSRSVLKATTLRVPDIGAAPLHPIPWFVGLFGHSYPERSLFQYFSLEDYTTYLHALK